jgi:ribonucleotide reductase beta subunit family protein with ferritin-like domain
MTCTPIAYQYEVVLEMVADIKDFIELVHQELLIRPASPLTIREIVRDAYDYELNYAESIVKNNDYLNLDKIVELLKENTNKTLRILGQPPYFHATTV